MRKRPSRVPNPRRILLIAGCCAAAVWSLRGTPLFWIIITFLPVALLAVCAAFCRWDRPPEGVRWRWVAAVGGALVSITTMVWSAPIDIDLGARTHDGSRLVSQAAVLFFAGPPAAGLLVGGALGTLLTSLHRGGARRRHAFAALLALVSIVTVSVPWREDRRASTPPAARGERGAHGQLTPAVRCPDGGCVDLPSPESLGLRASARALASAVLAALALVSALLLARRAHRMDRLRSDAANGRARSLGAYRENARFHSTPEDALAGELVDRSLALQAITISALVTGFGVLLLSGDPTLTW